MIPVLLLSLGLFFSCAGAEVRNDAEIRNGTEIKTSTCVQTVKGTKKQSPASPPGEASAVFHVGWFESRFAGERAEEIAAEGCSIVVPYVGSRGDAETVADYLDSAAAAGLKVALQIPGDFVRSGNTKAIEDWVLRFRDHRAVELWYLFDEPEIHGIEPNRLKAVYQYLKDEGRGRKIAVAFYNPQKAQRSYAGSFDILWLNYYPVMRGTKEFIGISIGNFKGRVKAGKKAAIACKADFGMIVQAYGVSDSGENQFNRRLPSAAELRYMVWASLMENPSYVLFWSRYRSSEDWLKTVFKPTVGPILELLAPGMGIQPLNAKGFSVSGGKVEFFHFRIGKREVVALIGGSRAIRHGLFRLPEGAKASALQLPWGSSAKETDKNNWILDLPVFGVVLFEIQREA